MCGSETRVRKARDSRERKPPQSVWTQSVAAALAGTASGEPEIDVSSRGR